MAAAVIPQIGAMSEAAEAQKKYEDAVKATGAASREAVTAEAEYLRLIADMPPATRRAAAAMGVLKDDFKAWSDNLAGATMEPFTKGLYLTNRLLPATTGLVRGSAGELDRLMDIAGGAMATPGFDAFAGRAEGFVVGTLRDLNDGLISLMREGDGGGEVGAAAAEFMDYARENGPLVRETLSSIAEAALNLATGVADAGPGLLTIVSALAGLVAAVPPEVITTLMGVYTAVKLIGLAGAGAGLLASGYGAARVQIATMGAAAGGATGRVAGLSAALSTLSTKAKLAMAATGVGLLVLALSELSQVGQTAPPDVDRLTTSLGQLAREGDASGEAAKAFGSDLGELYDKVRSFTDPATIDKVQEGIVNVLTLGQADSTPVKEAKKNLDAIDQSLANLVRGGKADLAAAALTRLEAAYSKGGKSPGDLKKRLDEYKQSLEDQAFEAELAADAQGLFGAQAQRTQEKLAAQKASADGLRQSLQALNDTQRGGIGGMIGFEAALDATAKAAAANKDALTMSGGQLNLNSEKARTAAQSLNDMAASTDQAAASARESGADWETVNGIYARGRDAIIRNADAMGLSKDQAKQLADQILQIPDKEARVKMDREDALAGLDSVIAKIKATPGAKSVTVKTLSKSAIDALEGVGYKVRRLPDGSLSVTAKTGSALGGIRSVQGARDALSDKSITITTRRLTVLQTLRTAPQTTADAVSRQADLFRASGGPVYGPGTGTSDSVLIAASDGEYVVRAAAVDRYGLAFLDALNEERLPDGTPVAGRFASGGRVSRGKKRPPTKAQKAAAERARIKIKLEAAANLKEVAKDLGKALLAGMLGSRDKIRATAKDLIRDIQKAAKGRKESDLVRMVNRETKEILELASKRDVLAGKIKRARDFAESTRLGAKKTASLGSMFEGDEKVTAGKIHQRLQARLAKMRTFTSYVRTLAKRGLNKTMLKEILEMGPDEGYAYASALVGANSKLFNEINQTQFKINKKANELGMVGADRLYDAGKNAGKGYLRGLSDQQKAIEDQMVKIAKGMEKAIKKALGIKSPSTVMARLGTFTTQGLARGLVDGVPALDRALGVVSGRVAETRPVLGRPALTGAGAGGQPVHVQVDVHGAMDPVAVGREMQRTFLRLKRDFGMNIQLGVA
ncbi:hypothetical protein [Streptomyces uncialis]|uniref:hypothetical protein n=1 Tax=Streptomyces uncialis TaxID=1048205 RepID=UPI0033EB18BF